MESFKFIISVDELGRIDINVQPSGKPLMIVQIQELLRVVLDMVNQTPITYNGIPEDVTLVREGKNASE
jgi:hypothetical protein